MLKKSDYYKIMTAVPVQYVAKVRQAMGDAGAGVQGNYSHCSGSHKTVGRFTPQEGAQPAIGKIGQPEEVEEETVEMLCHKDKIEEVVRALKQAHPYEEPPIDILKRFEVE